MEIELATLTVDPTLQMRVGMSDAVVLHYAELMADGVVFPPIVVFRDGAMLWLADGFHRVAAARRARLVQLAADVRDGTRSDALLLAVQANITHGLRVGVRDRSKAIYTLLEDPHFAGKSDREIARITGATHPTVAAARKNVLAGIEIRERMEREALAERERNLAEANDPALREARLAAEAERHREAIERARAERSTHDQVTAELAAAKEEARALPAKKKEPDPRAIMLEQEQMHNIRACTTIEQNAAMIITQLALIRDTKMYEALGFSTLEAYAGASEAFAQLAQALTAAGVVPVVSEPAA